MKYYSYFLCWEFSKGLFVWVKTLLLFNEVIGQTEWANTCLTDSLQLTCLNLSNNRIHKLDELAELITKVPHLKTLNLSHNEVKTVWLLSWWMITWHEWGGGQKLGPWAQVIQVVLTLICVVQLKSDRELDKIKGLKLVELWLNRNPLCDLFKDQASYIRSVGSSGGWGERNVRREHGGMTCVCVHVGVSPGPFSVPQAVTVVHYKRSARHVYVRCLHVNFSYFLSCQVWAIGPSRSSVHTNTLDLFLWRVSQPDHHFLSTAPT